MDDRFKIYVEQLRDGHTEKIDEEFAPAFLEVNDETLKFTDKVFVQGQAYLAENDLILNLNIQTKAQLPCSICNEYVSVPIEIRHFYHTEPVAAIKGSVFNYKEVLREVIVLEAPPFAECEGRCPQRNEINKYFAKENGKEKNPEEGYHPFSDL